MNRSGLTCPSCGSSNIVDDDLYCNAQLVCVDCGTVVSEGSLADDPVGGSDISYSRSAVTKIPCRNLRKGLMRVKEISRIIRVRREIEDLALSYFKQVYEHEDFINVSLTKKEVLAGCCVLVSCRQRNWPITVATISFLLNADQALVGGVFKDMLTILKLETLTVGVIDVLEAHCQEYKISSDQVPEEFAEDCVALTKRAKALVELAAESWIVTGRKPIHMVMAATYLAWQSLKPNKHRLKISLDRFCHLAKVQKHQSAMTRILELKKVLCKLGREIPWLRETVTPDSVVRLVGDILEHRFTLLRSALRNHEHSLQAEHSLDPPKEETAASQPQEHVELKENPAENYPIKQRQAVDGDRGQQSQEPESNWGKRVLFAPPCVIHRKRRRTEQPELGVTGNEEISDSEIDSYIRSPQEVRDLIQAKTMLSSDICKV
uniref:Transcription factor IIIB 50 kDa subunit n=1 Tax=Iconisemion striatum TaxID=60296 RepID=A0A1A7WNW4_9TELE